MFYIFFPPPHAVAPNDPVLHLVRLRERLGWWTPLVQYGVQCRRPLAAILTGPHTGILKPNSERNKLAALSGGATPSTTTAATLQSSSAVHHSRPGYSARNRAPGVKGPEVPAEVDDGNHVYAVLRNKGLRDFYNPYNLEVVAADVAFAQPKYWTFTAAHITLV